MVPMDSMATCYSFTLAMVKINQEVELDSLSCSADLPLLSAEGLCACQKGWEGEGLLALMMAMAMRILVAMAMLTSNTTTSRTTAIQASHSHTCNWPQMHQEVSIRQSLCVTSRRVRVQYRYCRWQFFTYLLVLVCRPQLRRQLILEPLCNIDPQGEVRSFTCSRNPSKVTSTAVKEGGYSCGHVPKRQRRQSGQVSPTLGKGRGKRTSHGKPTRASQQVTSPGCPAFPSFPARLKQTKLDTTSAALMRIIVRTTMTPPKKRSMISQTCRVTQVKRAAGC